MGCNFLHESFTLCLGGTALIAFVKTASVFRSEQLGLLRFVRWYSYDHLKNTRLPETRAHRTEGVARRKRWRAHFDPRFV
jgi:hypothetical protein